MQLLYVWAKKIHRVVMWVALALGSGMMFGGLVMHQQLEGGWIPPGVDTLLVRELHNTMAVPFTVALLLMMITGLIMWIVPKILSKRINKPINQPTN